MGLQEEINNARADIRTDGYPVSIGEWVSMYEKGEIDIHPEFQRFFRWTDEQKSRLIESILLGIPIPPIYVSQREDGVWDVVDGLQRLSTIFQFIGILKNENDTFVPSLVLEEAPYLKSLAGKTWENENLKKSLTRPQQLLIKRGKIDVSIILKESEQSAKYELFQRLNTGGTPLSPQEVRDAILVSINPECYQWLRNLANEEDFKTCIALTDRATEEQYDVELVVRFIAFRRVKNSELKDVGDLGDFLTSKIVAVAKQKDYDYGAERKRFRQTFRLLAQATADDTFRRFDPHKDDFVGGFLVSAYEAIALGIGYNVERVDFGVVNIVRRIKSIWSNDEFTQNSGSGIRASTRVAKIIPYGRKLFAS